uniref:flagellar hook-length control protein FliK n=1 Tax=Brevundimonas sp. TaxID=1871086 RepID=UPI0025FA8762
ERPLVLPGGLETAAKPHGPLILPAEAGRPSPTTLSLLAAVTGQARADGAAETIRRMVAEAPEVTPPQPVEGKEASAPDVQLSSLPTAPSGSEPSPATPARAGAPTPDTGAARSETAASPRGAAETGEVAETAPDAPLEDGIDVLPVSTREAIAPQPARPDAAAVQRQSFDAVTQVAAQIIRRLEGRSTRFEMELHPADMGRVDVRLDIDAEGRVAARLAFDNPAAAADLRGRADELRRNLEDAGFQLADDALDFADREGRGRRDAGDRDPFARSAREAELADAEAQPVLRSLNRLGLDVRI